VDKHAARSHRERA